MDGEDGDSGSESDTSSIRSNASRNTTTPRGSKRKHGDSTATDDSSDEESTLSKKQRVANSRTTGLKMVKTPNGLLSANGLPTPGPMSDGGDGEDDAATNDSEGVDELEDDLEKEMMAEFEREEAEALGGDGG